MSSATQSSNYRNFTVPFGVFIGLFIIGLIVIGTSAPFWQMLLVAVVAGLVGFTVGRVVRRRQ